VNWNVVGLRELNKLGKLSIDSKDEQPLQRASIRPECFPDGTQSIQQIRRANASTGWCRLNDPR